MKLRDLFSDDAMIDPQAEAVAVSGLAVDSRAVRPGDLFFALTGHKTDGARFIDSAVSSGAVAVAADRPPQAGSRVPFVVTPNPLSNIRPSRCCAVALPCSAARRYQ